jgi:hypothetical protein
VVVVGVAEGVQEVLQLRTLTGWTVWVRIQLVEGLLTAVEVLCDGPRTGRRGAIRGLELDPRLLQ